MFDLPTIETHGRAWPRTPGPYLKHRREAAHLSPRDVAARLATEPHLLEHARAELLELIEADIQPVDLNTLIVLRRVFPFDMSVLFALAEIALGIGTEPPRLCRICACSEHDACVSEAGRCCSWIGPDLCSAHGLDLVA